MKKYLLIILFIVTSVIGRAQTATDFTANDCNGVSHNFFTDLNTGQVIVLVWVMPCGACVSASLTTYNVVQSYLATYPNGVRMYVCDDYGDTYCSSLNSWANSNGLTNTVRFSSTSINMLDYGSTGMPKIVVVGGGSSHTVFYNSNNTVNAGSLQNAINSALLATGIQEPEGTASSLKLFPNPAANTTEITYKLAKASEVQMELFNAEGQLVKVVFSGKLPSGENKIPLSLAEYSQGVYQLKCSDGVKSRFLNVLVSR